MGEQHPSPYPPPYASYSPQGPPPTQPYPTSPSSQQRPTALVPAWMLPAVAVLALVPGLNGGAIAASLIDPNNTAPPGGVLRAHPPPGAPLPADNRSIAAVASKVLP